MNPVEALADAIMSYERWQPGSLSYRNRNPGNLRATDTGQPADHNGYRLFEAFVLGYLALASDLEANMAGRAEAGIGPASSLRYFLAAWAPLTDGNDPSGYAEYVAGFLSRALGREVYPTTTLGELAEMGGR